MRCPTCGGDNVDGAKFCGVCGQRLTEGPPTIPPGQESPLAASRRASTAPPGAPPRVTGETRTMTGPPQSQAVLTSAKRHDTPVPAPAPAAKRKPPPPSPEASLGESLRVPEARGSRMVKIGIVLAVDAALAIAGIVLLARGGDGGEARAADVAMIADAGAGSAIASGEPPAPGPGTSAGGGGGGGTSGGGGGGGGGTSAPSTRIDAGTGILPPGTGSTDAGSGTSTFPPFFVDAGTAPPPPVDAAATTPPPPIDAPPAVEPPTPIDAPPAIEPPPTPIDAPEGPIDTTDAPEAAASAADIARHLSRLVVQSAGKMDRCYQNATKALPPDQALSGQVDIGLAVMPTGQVENVRVVNNTTGSNDLGACVQATVAAWDFPAHGESEPVEFVSPFRFGPGS
jgi:hypothetical protein